MSEETATAVFAIKCGPCGGTGNINPDTPCLNCKAQGALLLEGSVDDYRDCPNCGSSGFIGFDASQVCRWCHGSGAVPIRN